jgi:TP901 family phage tail tape measure protein
MATAATISARLTLDSSTYQSGLAKAQGLTQNFSQSLKNLGGSLTQLGGMATAAFTVPIVAGATAATAAFIALDTQMRNIQSISLEDDMAIESLRQRFISMSTDLSITRDSAEKLAEAFYFIQSAGFAGEAGMTVLTVATAAATAGLTDTMTAGNAILAVLNAYGLEAEDAAHVSDVLFKTVDLGVLTFNDLATQLGDVVQTGAMAGISIEELGASLALMTRKGIQPSEAVTALNQLMLQFISPSEKMKKAAEAAGIELNIATLRTLGMGGALDMMITKFGDSDVFLELFGDNVRALKGALALGGKGIEEYNTILEQFGDVNGRTMEAFATQNKSVAAQLDSFKNKITALGLALATIFLPILMQVVDAITPFVEKLLEADPELLKWGLLILGIIAVLGPMLIFIGMIVTAIGTIAALLATPIGIVIAIILVLIVVLALLKLAWDNNWFGFRDTLKPVLHDVFETLHNILFFFFDFWEQLRVIHYGGGGDLSVIWHSIFHTVTNTIRTAMANMGLLVQAALAALSGDWFTFGERIRQILDNSISAWGVAIQHGINNFRVIIWNGLMSALSAFTNENNWRDVGQNVSRGIANGITSGLQWIRNAAIAAARAAMQAAMGFLGIHSPARLPALQIGYPMAQGVAMGWQKGLAAEFSPATIGRNLTGATIPTGGVGAGSQDGVIISLLQQLVNKGSDGETMVRLVRDLIQQMKD